MDDVQREDLIERLKNIKHLRLAAREIQALDSDANMKFWRNAIWQECQTMFELPNAGLKITLVEKNTLKETNHKVGGGPKGWTAKKSEFEMVDVRIEPLK